MDEIIGLHVNWSKPHLIKQVGGYWNNAYGSVGNSRYYIDRIYLLMTFLSILYYKKQYKHIVLFADSKVVDFYSRVGILELYDDVNTEFLDSYDTNPLFWTSGKIASLNKLPTPFIYIDNDMFLKEKLTDEHLDKDLVITHWELSRGECYISHEQDVFTMDGWRPFDGWKHNMLATNTSFLYFNNQELLNYYVREHLRATTAKIDNDRLLNQFWLLIDQVMLGQCARTFGANVGTLNNKIYVPFPEEGMPDEDLKKTNGVGVTPQYIDWNWENFSENSCNKTNIKYQHLWTDKCNFKTRSKYYINEFIKQILTFDNVNSTLRKIDDFYAKEKKNTTY